jgi:hypothetical protein
MPGFFQEWREDEDRRSMQPETLLMPTRSMVVLVVKIGDLWWRQASQTTPGLSSTAMEGFRINELCSDLRRMDMSEETMSLIAKP